jgi:hypothetical protein
LRSGNRHRIRQSSNRGFHQRRRRPHTPTTITGLYCGKTSGDGWRPWEQALGLAPAERHGGHQQHRHGAGVGPDPGLPVWDPLPSTDTARHRKHPPGSRSEARDHPVSQPRDETTSTGTPGPQAAPACSIEPSWTARRSQSTRVRPPPGTPPTRRPFSLSQRAQRRLTTAGSISADLPGRASAAAQRGSTRRR